MKSVVNNFFIALVDYHNNTVMVNVNYIISFGAWAGTTEVVLSEGTKFYTLECPQCLYKRISSLSL